jgi:hypothetical protein
MIGPECEVLFGSYGPSQDFEGLVSLSGGIRVTLTRQGYITYRLATCVITTFTRNSGFQSITYESKDFSGGKYYSHQKTVRECTSLSFD